MRKREKEYSRENSERVSPANAASVIILFLLDTIKSPPSINPLAMPTDHLCHRNPFPPPQLQTFSSSSSLDLPTQPKLQSDRALELPPCRASPSPSPPSVFPLYLIAGNLRQRFLKPAPGWQAVIRFAMGSKGRMPPYHHHHQRGPLPAGPAHGMMHRDPYGPGMHPPPPGPGQFPYDMLPPPPPPEILEQKLAAQCGEMQKLAVENERLAASHASLRKELAAAQQELQRLQAQGEASRVAEEQEMRGLLDKVSKMEADLKAYESVKADLQQAHAEAQNLVAARQHLVADVQKLSKDLQRNIGEAQQLPALMAERDAARQEYEHLRATYEYERKLKMDHSESLQVMKRNYDSMVTELEKLRAELTNTTNIDKSGALYNPNFAQKDGGTSSRHSVGQTAYDGGYGGAQARTPPAGLADPLSGSPAGTAPRSGFDPSRGNAYDTSRLASFNSSKAGGHDASRGASGYDSLKGAGYDASKTPALGAQAAAATAHGSSAGYYGSSQATPPSYAWAPAAPTYGSSVQMPPSYASGPVPSSSYSATTARPHGSAQVLPSYGQTQAPSSYGHSQIQSSYGLAQPPSHFAPAQGASSYGLAAQPPAYGSGQAAPHAGGAYQAPHGRK